MTDKCEVCGGDFTRRSRIQRTCSRTCNKNLWHRENKWLRKRKTRPAKPIRLSPDGALLMCGNGHHHFIGRDQLDLADELCIFCHAPMEIKQVGWIQPA